MSIVKTKRQLVYNYILYHPGCFRREIHENTKINKNTIISAIHNMMNEGVIINHGGYHVWDFEGKDWRNRN